MVLNKKISLVLSEVLEFISPGEEEKKNKEKLDIFIKALKTIVSKEKIDADVFLGGSFAKGTVVKKRVYDADVFLRYDKKHKGKDISLTTEKIIKKIVKRLGKNYRKIHGSRDYFELSLSSDFNIEIIPVMKQRLSSGAENITDLSYMHVNYVKKKTNDKKRNEIKLAKAFCYANKIYGAESYINGFSGYVLELLIIKYGSFIKMIKELSKPLPKDKKIVIDIEKKYKNKEDVLRNVNESKLSSPIILIDPTYKERNAAAALSYESYDKFVKISKEFMKSPSVNLFRERKTDIKEKYEEAKKNKRDFIHLEISTDKQEGDVAGTKLYKFYNFLNSEIEKHFVIYDKGFNYNNVKGARFYFIGKSKESLVVQGPRVEQKEHVKAFIKKHKNHYTKEGRLYSKITLSPSLTHFIKDWKAKNKHVMKSMYIESLNVLNNI